MQAPSSSDNVLPSGKTRNLAPNDEASESNGPTPNILAFRTITTLLTQLPRNTPIAVVDNLGQDNVKSSERREINILDAFAHVVAGDYDVTALVTNHGFYDSSKELRVLSCVDYLPVDQSVSNIWSLSGLVTNQVKPWLSMFTKNNPKHETDTCVEIPTIISALVPDDMGQLDPHSYLRKLLACWKKPSLSNHLWILSKILTRTPGSADGSNDLPVISRYIAAMSYNRMFRQFNNNSLSQPFVKSLRDVGNSEIPPLSQPRRNPADKQPTLPQANINSANERRRRQEVESDLVFLETVVLLSAKNGMIRTDITNLIKIAKGVSATGEDIQMYTDETRVEFHNVLIELLDRFGEALGELGNIGGKKQGVETGAKETAPVLDANAARLFNKHLCELYRSGYALLRISKGRAFQMHLKNIEKLLQDHRASIAGISVDESDEDPQALIGKTMLQSYTAWLQLLVRQFDAVEILLHFVYSDAFPYKSISIEILAAPKTDRALLPWKQLFTDNIIPPSTNIESPSNDDLLKFLEKHREAFLNCKATSSQVQDAFTASKAFNPISPTIFTDLKGYADTIVVQKANDILAHVDDYNAQPREFSTQIGEAISALQTRLEEIDSRTKVTDSFFMSLDDTNFQGTLHCEACLASLLPNFTNTTKLSFKSSEVEDMNILMSKMQEFGRVIGVSKRCCPTCATFLKALTMIKVPTKDTMSKDAMTKAAPEPFIVRGNHSTISPCTLPPWIPNAIAEAMVNSYAYTLRQDLVAFKNMVENKARSNNRCQSTSSGRLSVDSFVKEAFRQNFSKVGSQ